MFKAEAQTSALAVADSLYAVGEYDKAIAEIQKIQPKSEGAYLRLAKFNRADGRIEEALQNYELVLARNPKRLLTAMDYGELLSRSGKLKKADSLFNNLIKKYPETAGFYYQLGLVKEKQDDSTAIGYFRFTVTLDPGHQAALYKLAKNELKQRHYEQAEQYARQGLTKNPTNVSLLSILGQTYSSQEMYEEAIAPYERLIALKEGSEFIHTKLGFAYYQVGDYKLAIDNYKEALNFEDRNAATHYTLGKLYALTGDLDKSETHLLMAILIKKQPVDAEYLSLGLTKKLQKDYKLALEYYNKALDENPDNERAMYERAVAADNYFADLKTKINYYQAYLNKYGEEGSAPFPYLVKTRLQDLKEELHLSE